MQPALPYVPYLRGMFQHAEDTACFFTHERITAHHEAGHAVAAYVVGIPLESITVTSEDVENGSFVNGLVQPATLTWGRAARRPTWRRIRDGIMICAGPAAERRFRLSENLPMCLLRYTEGDHDAMRGHERALSGAGHDYRPFTRLSWYAAQRLMNDDRAWNAACETADEIIHGYVPDYSECETTGRKTTIYSLPLHHFYAICRKHGLSHGMLKRRRPATDDQPKPA